LVNKAEKQILKLPWNPYQTGPKISVRIMHVLVLSLAKYLKARHMHVPSHVLHSGHDFNKTKKKRCMHVNPHTMR
jgi:hypothetical protein